MLRWRESRCRSLPHPTPHHPTPHRPTPLQVLLKWNVQRGVAVVPKSGSEAHLRENIEGLFSWRLTWDQKVGGGGSRGGGCFLGTKGLGAVGFWRRM